MSGFGDFKLKRTKRMKLKKILGIIKIRTVFFIQNVITQSVN